MFRQPVIFFRNRPVGQSPIRRYRIAIAGVLTSKRERRTPTSEVAEFRFFIRDVLVSSASASSDPRRALSRSDNEETMLFEWTSGALAEGLRCYRNQEFFSAHEHWEAEWLKCSEPEKTFLQALIQVTAAFHHLQRDNFAGTASLLRAALRRLENFPAEFQGVAVEHLRNSIRTWLEALDSGGAPPQLPFPQIH